MPPLSTHHRFATLILPSLGIVSNAGCFFLGTTAPDAFVPDSEGSFSQHHFKDENGSINLKRFIETTKFVHYPTDDPVWPFTCGYYCHLWLDVFYSNNADRISIQRPADMPDAELRRRVRRETEILNAPFVWDAADLPISWTAQLSLPTGLEFVDPERCRNLFQDVIKQSREWSVLPTEFELIDRAGYVAFLENASRSFLNEFQIAA